MLSILLLFFILNRVRQRKLRNRQINRMEPVNHPTAIGVGYGMNYMSGGNVSIECPYESQSGHYHLWKPMGAYFPRGEAPPPYEEAVALGQAEASLNGQCVVSVATTTHRTLPLNICGTANSCDIPSNLLANTTNLININISNTNNASITSSSVTSNGGDTANQSLQQPQLNQQNVLCDKPKNDLSDARQIKSPITYSTYSSLPSSLEAAAIVPNFNDPSKLLNTRPNLSVTKMENRTPEHPNNFPKSVVPNLASVDTVQIIGDNAVTTNVQCKDFNCNYNKIRGGSKLYLTDKKFIQHTTLPLSSSSISGSKRSTSMSASITPRRHRTIPRHFTTTIVSDPAVDVTPPKIGSDDPFKPDSSRKTLNRDRNKIGGMTTNKKPICKCPIQHVPMTYMGSNSFYLSTLSNSTVIPKQFTHKNDVPTSSRDQSPSSNANDLKSMQKVAYLNLPFPTGVSTSGKNQPTNYPNISTISKQMCDDTSDKSIGSAPVDVCRSTPQTPKSNLKIRSILKNRCEPISGDNDTPTTVTDLTTQSENIIDSPFPLQLIDSLAQTQFTDDIAITLNNRPRTSLSMVGDMIRKGGSELIGTRRSLTKHSVTALNYNSNGATVSNPILPPKQNKSNGIQTISKETLNNEYILKSDSRLRLLQNSPPASILHLTAFSPSMSAVSTPSHILKHPTQSRRQIKESSQTKSIHNQRSNYSKTMPDLRDNTTSLHDHYTLPKNSKHQTMVKHKKTGDKTMRYNQKLISSGKNKSLPDQIPCTDSKQFELIGVVEPNSTTSDVESIQKFDSDKPLPVCTTYKNCSNPKEHFLPNDTSLDDDYLSECENCKSAHGSRYYLNEKLDEQPPQETMTLQRKLDDNKDELDANYYRQSTTLPTNPLKPKTSSFLKNREPWFSTIPASSSSDEDQCE